MAIGEQLGGTAGGLGGKALGTAVAGPLGGIAGGMIGSSIGSAIGGGVESLFGGGGGGDKEVARADPNQVARLKEIDRTRKQISSGTDPITRSAISEIKKTGETTKGQLAKFTGGDVGGTISSFLRAQRNTGKGINDRFTATQGRVPFFENLSTQLGNRISQRKLELDINAQDTQRAQQAQSQTNKNLNLSGVIASSIGNDGLGGLLGKKGGEESGEFSPQIGQTFSQGISGQGQSITAEALSPELNSGGAFGQGIGGGGGLGSGFGGFGS